LAVGDVLGRKVRVPLYEKKEAGYNDGRFDWAGLASGKQKATARRAWDFK